MPMFVNNTSNPRHANTADLLINLIYVYRIKKQPQTVKVKIWNQDNSTDSRNNLQRQIWKCTSYGQTQQTDSLTVPFQ